MVDNLLKREIKLIATDLDGTLLNSEHEITPRTERALKAAIARGVPVILATGKTVHSRHKPIAQLGLNTPGVYSQGLVLINADGSVRYQRDLDNPTACRVVQFAEARGLNLAAIVEGGNRLIAPERHSLTDFMVAHHEPEADYVGPLSAVIDHLPVTKVLVEIPPAQMADTYAELAGQLNGTAALVQSMPHLLEILPPGASKGDGLRRLLDDLGVDPAHVLACGDRDNDFEMLEMVGIGVAMANGSDRLKSIADYVTASNDEDGVGLAVEKFVLHGQPAIR
jgi:Cof subfamily protein (haloacid dehalogenase superfamily)